MKAKQSNLSRRDFLRASAMTAVGVLAASCARPTAEIVKETVVVEKEVVVEKPVEKIVKETVIVEKEVEVEKIVTPEVPSQLREAPMVMERVNAGQLPPLEERLPPVPKVCNEMPPSQLAFQVGRHGGTIRTLTPAAQWDTDVYVFCNEPLINTPGILGEEITGNICDWFQVSADQTEFTFHLRQGTKWSDGTPVTTEDVRFAYEDVIMNTELTSRPPNWLRSGNDPGGDPLEVTITDDYTFTIKFTQPYGGFLLSIAIQGWQNYVDLLKPAHFLKKIHTAYASQADIDAAIAEAEVEGWPQLFALKDVSQWDLSRGPAFKDFPALTPWLLTETSQEGQIFERNPYYLKVDPAGNQLPYVDYLDSRYVADAEVIQMKMLAGECDFARSNPKMVKLPLYKENEEKGGFKTGFAKFHATSIDLTLNMTHQDPVWREVVRNVDFRRALNMAIDRDEIVDAIWYGYAEPSTIVPSEYDPEKAKQLLDQIGMDKKDANGYRLGPDGNVFEIPFETGAQRVDMIPTLELVVQFWEAIGIRTTMKKIDVSLWDERRNANEMKATIYWTPALWYQGGLQQLHWGTLWYQWWTTGGEQGEEPPDDVKEVYRALASITLVSPEDGLKAYQRVRDLMYENVYYFIPTENIMQPLVYNARLGNVSESEDAFAIGVNFSAEQFFYKS